MIYFGDNIFLELLVGLSISLPIAHATYLIFTKILGIWIDSNCHLVSQINDGRMRLRENFIMRGETLYIHHCFQNRITSQDTPQAKELNGDHHGDQSLRSSCFQDQISISTLFI